jgi:hypothetical protein
MFPSLYLGSADLNGKDVNLTIRRVIVEEVKTEQGAKKKPVAYFLETKAKAEKIGQPDKEKRLILNKTNAMMIASMHGNEVDGWTGKRITVYPTKAEAFGKIVDALRVRETAPTGEAVSPATDPAIATGAT